MISVQRLERWTVLLQDGRFDCRSMLQASLKTIQPFAGFERCASCGHRDRGL